MSLPFRPRRPSRRISLALQGGGAHGAYTWGVLDALLDDGRLDFDGISGTSAGAMNAVVLAHGLAVRGQDGAREALQAFWQSVAASVPFDATLGADPASGDLSIGMRLMLSWTRRFSARQLNPFDINPLRQILARQIDFDRLRAASPIALFVAATRISDGKLRLFRNRELSVEALLASACQPSIHHAIEIDGEHYWDGAYSANPAVYPLFYDCAADDILLVLLTPRNYGEAPQSPDEVSARSMELAFNAAFLREMAAFARADAAARRTLLPLSGFERRFRRTRFHLIEADSLTSRLASESKLTTSLAFLEMLRDAGRNDAQAWLAAHRNDLGRRSSTDLGSRFG
ncbi:MAG TPA: patatin-like phospholipase family protein [Burkholderiaceae bacterium]|nr:patatin-like phospholipase family protein [Burkholderiaceae bacterium]